MTAPTTSFSQQLHRFKKQLEARATRVVRLTVMGLGATLISKSPWGRWEEWGEEWQSIKPKERYIPGRFKNSWDYDFNVQPSAQFDSPDKAGSESKARIAASMTTPAFSKHYLVNNTPYAIAIEYGYARHNKPDPTPPKGLLRTTVIEWRDILGAAVKEVRGK